MSGRRIFIAIDLSDEARKACGERIERLRNDFPRVRVGWERPEKLHLTLKFLGDSHAAICQALDTGLKDIASAHSRFTLRLSQPGVFPSPSRPRILWVGIEDPAKRAGAIQEEIENLTAGLGFERETRSFSPHVTIGRFREARGAETLAKLHIETKIEPVEFEVAKIVVYESKLQPSGSIYSPVSTHQLGS